MECVGLMTNGKKLQSKMRASQSQLCSSAPGLSRRLLRGYPLWLQLHEEPAEKCSCNRYQFCLLFSGELQGLGKHIRSTVLCSLPLPVPLLPAQVKHSYRWMLILWKGNRQDSKKFRKHYTRTLSLVCIYFEQK